MICAKFPAYFEKWDQDNELDNDHELEACDSEEYIQAVYFCSDIADTLQKSEASFLPKISCC